MLIKWLTTQIQFDKNCYLKMGLAASNISMFILAIDSLVKLLFCRAQEGLKLPEAQ